jgi:hypothetical protein
LATLEDKARFGEPAERLEHRGDPSRLGDNTDRTVEFSCAAPQNSSA